MKHSSLIVVVLLVGLSACSNNIGNIAISSIPNSINYDHNGLFEFQPQILNQDQLFELNENQIKNFNQFFNHATNKHLATHIRVSEYLKKSTSNFTYKTKTMIASEVMEQEQGNCLSLAIYTTAIARLASVDVGYQLIESSPVFEQKNSTVIKGMHIRSKLYKQKFNHELPISDNQGLVIDYFPDETNKFVGNISQPEFIARYYMNIATDFLLNHDYSSSYWHTLKSLEYTPNNPDAINLMAVLFNRSGDSKKAEEIYLYGIKNTKKKLTLLKNYHLLLTKQNRQKEALFIHNKIVELNDPSPFYWLTLADKAYQSMQWKEAKKLYKKAIHRGPKYSLGYFGLSKTYHSMGKMKSALREINKAIKYNSNKEYEIKFKQQLKLYNTSNLCTVHDNC